MIGGEFQIAVTDVLNAQNRHLEAPDVYTYSSGRAALYQILKYLKQERGVSSVLLPDYLCCSVLVPVKELGLDYMFYPINEKLELKPASFQPLYKKGIYAGCARLARRYPRHGVQVRCRALPRVQDAI